MRKSVFVSLASIPALILSLTLATGAFSPDAEGQTSITPQSVCNSIDRDMVLSYDTSGGTLLGPYNVNLQVFTNGEIKYSRSIGLAPDIAVVHASATVQEVKQLQHDLAAAGAFNLCDQNIAVADVPLNTVTVLRGKQNGKYHTFSFWLGFGNSYSSVLSIINQFISDHVPGS